MGIWGVDPYVPREGTPFDAAANAAGKVQGLFGQYYKNQGSQLDNQLKQGQVTEMNQTLPQKIAALNAKYGADEKYYPLIQEANLAQENAKIKEIMARTGLTYAQSKVMMAHLPLLQAQTNEANMRANPMAKFNSMYQSYENSPNGSPQKAFLAELLNQEMGTGGMGGSRTRASATGPSTMQIGEDGNMVQNPIGGGRYGTRQAYDPETGQTFESPTMQSGTRNQSRIEANKEIASAAPVIQKGLSPYYGPLGKINLLKDSYLANTSPNSAAGKKAAEDLYNYSLANRLKRETANMISRQSGVTNLGVEGAREQEASSFGNNPLIPQSIQEKSLNAYFPLQEQLANSALNVERGGYPNSSQNPPAWANQQNGGYFGANGYVEPQQQNQQQNAPSETNLNVPQFNSDKEFKSWYSNLSPEEKAEYRKRLRGG